jgi:hypothetical protein
MKALLGIVSLLLVLGITSMLVKKQLPAGTSQNPQQQAQAVEQQVRQKLDAAMQQARPAPEEK